MAAGSSCSRNTLSPNDAAHCASGCGKQADKTFNRAFTLCSFWIIFPGPLGTLAAIRGCRDIKWNGLRAGWLSVRELRLTL